MKRIFFPSLALAILIMGSVASAPAGAERTFVSLRGGFYVTYPDTWRKVQFNEVDMYLMANRADTSMYNYEAVLTAHDGYPFYRGSYMIITFDSLGQMSGKQIDSVLKSLGHIYGKGVKYYPVANFLTDMHSNEPTYDANHKLVSIVSDITEGQETMKKHLLMMKFFKNGIANFYCYSPDSLFDSMKTVFNKVALSLGTDDIDAALERQTKVDMAPIGGTRTVKNAGEVETSEPAADPTVILLLIAVVVALVAVFVLMKQRKKRA